MKITLVKPIAYCNGVKNAIDILERTISENNGKHIYVYGDIIHNLFVIKKYAEKGVIYLDKALEAVKEIEKDSTLIIPAHGAPKQVFDYLEENNITFYDATCPFIKENIKEIKATLNNKQSVIYIGDEKHDESVGILSISNNIYLKDKKLLNNNYLLTNDKPVIVCQSTLENTLLDKEIADVLSCFPTAINKARICNSSVTRQNAIINIDSSVDLLYIVGDKHSNNTLKLLDVAKRHHPQMEAYIIGSFLEIRKDVTKNKNHIAIASGASTPDFIIDAVVAHINFLDKLFK